MLCSTLRIDFNLIIDYEKSIINNSMILVYYLELKTKLVKCNELSYKCYIDYYPNPLIMIMIIGWYSPKCIHE